MQHPTDRIANTTAFVTLVVEHWLEREIAQWVHLMKDRSDDPSHHERTLLPRSYISLPRLRKEDNVLFNDALNTFYLRKKTNQKVREETRCCHMGYSFRLSASDLLYALSHRQDSTYHSMCYTSPGALVGTRNSSMGPPNEGSIRRSIAP